MGLPECKKIYDSLEQSKRDVGVAFLKGFILDNVKKEIRGVIVKDKKGWFALFHHGWGTGIRNALRNASYGEKYFGINNLDDIYVELVEDAVKVNK